MQKKTLNPHKNSHFRFVIICIPLNKNTILENLDGKTMEILAKTTKKMKKNIILIHSFSQENINPSTSLINTTQSDFSSLFLLF